GVIRIGNHDDVVQRIVRKFIRRRTPSRGDGGDNAFGSQIHYLYRAVAITHVKLVQIRDRHHSVGSRFGSGPRIANEPSTGSVLRNRIQKLQRLGIDYVDAASPFRRGPISQIVASAARIDPTDVETREAAWNGNRRDELIVGQ